jgi:hypothetical protein
MRLGAVACRTATARKETSHIQQHQQQHILQNCILHPQVKQCVSRHVTHSNWVALQNKLAATAAASLNQGITNLQKRPYMLLRLVLVLLLLAPLLPAGV